MTVFDRDPVAYEAVRPSDPPALVDDVIALAQLAPGARVLEVGSGTGRATRLFAARGLAVTAVEAGPALAAARVRARLLGHRVALDRSRARLRTRRHYPWHVDDDAKSYARLLGTYSDHLRLAAGVRARLLDGIAALIDTRFSGRIRKHYVADLYVVRAITPA